MHNIDQRLRQVYADLNTPFGGRSVLLLGDFAQSPPIFDKPLYRQGPLTVAAEAHARLIYERFVQSVFLKQLSRRSGCAMRRQPDDAREYTLIFFARGLSTGTGCRRQTWLALKRRYESIPQTRRSTATTGSTSRRLKLRVLIIPATRQA